jgi:hypothetical protein
MLVTSTASGLLTATYAAQRIIRNGRPLALATFHKKFHRQEIPPPTIFEPTRYWNAHQIRQCNEGLIRPKREIREWLEANPGFEDDPIALRESNTWCEYDPNTGKWAPLPNQYLTPPRTPVTREGWS